MTRGTRGGKICDRAKRLDLTQHVGHWSLVDLLACANIVRPTYFIDKRDRRWRVAMRGSDGCSMNRFACEVSSCSPAAARIWRAALSYYARRPLGATALKVTAQCEPIGHGPRRSPVPRRSIHIELVRTCLGQCCNCTPRARPATLGSDLYETHETIGNTVASVGELTVAIGRPTLRLRVDCCV
jgi:hypothetical protein